MAVENDILTGLDISSLTSVQQSQVLQMINQAAPLVNKGLIIYQSSAVAAPDVVNNPRYARYIWLDTVTNPPTPKIYDGAAWQSLIVGAGSIVNSMISAVAAIAITKLAFGTARYIVRTNAAGNAVEYVNPNAIFTNDDVPLSAINSTAAPALVKSYLQRNATTGITSFQQVAFADFAAGDLLGVTKIASGVNGQVLGTVTGAAAWADLATLIQPNSIGADKLTGAAAAYQVIRRNSVNGANEWGSIPFNRQATVDDSQGLDISLPEGSSNVRDIPHGLAARPVFVWGVLKCITDDLNYVAANGDEVPFHQLYDNTAANQGGRPCIGIFWDAVNIRFMGSNVGAGLRVTFNKTSGAVAAITQARWRLRAFAWV